MSEHSFEDVILNFKKKTHYELFPPHVPMTTYKTNCDVGLTICVDKIIELNTEIQVMKESHSMAQTKSRNDLVEKAFNNILSLESSKQQLQECVALLIEAGKKREHKQSEWGDYKVHPKK